jgi:hypothetical protein
MPYLELRDYSDGASNFQKEMIPKIINAVDDVIHHFIGVHGCMEFDYQRRSVFSFSDNNFVLVVDMGKRRGRNPFQPEIAKEIKKRLVEILDTDSCVVRLQLQEAVFA